MADDQFYDVLYGAAGGIVSLLSLHRLTKDPEILAAAVQCGEYLLEHQKDTANGKAWIVPATGDKPLAGFSHGAAGTAWALFHLSAVTQDERYAESARAAIEYERQIFCSEFGNWPDLRTMGTDKPSAHPDGLRFMNAWCHGASGVALGRLGIPQQFQDEQTRNEVELPSKRPG